MELLVIVALVVLVAAVVLYRKVTGKRPNDPEVPNNDGE